MGKSARRVENMIFEVDYGRVAIPNTNLITTCVYNIDARTREI